MKGCGVLFKTGSGLAICGEQKADGNQFFCSRCLKEEKQEIEKEKENKEIKKDNIFQTIEQALPLVKNMLSSQTKANKEDKQDGQ
ncbi:MAG: hypothetical protein ACOC56_05340 [Atribacterota bacterium]